MRLTENLYLAGSGITGIMLTDEWDCNCFLADFGDHKVLFDCGAGIQPEFLLEELQKDGIFLTKKDWLFITRCHLDHIGAVKYMKEYIGINVGVPEEEEEILQIGDQEKSGLRAAKEAGYYPKDFTINPCIADCALCNGEVWNFAKGTLEVIKVKGHSPGGNCYYLNLPEGRVLVSGDELNAEGKISLQVIPGADVLGYANSIEKLQEKAVDILLPGHGRVLLKNGSYAVEKAGKKFRTLFI